jgi:hypothetical protein
MNTAWLSLVLAGLQLTLLLARALERARIISEADVQATARLLSAARKATDDVTRDMDAAAARADSLPDDPTSAPDLHPLILEAVCKNLVPISGKSTDDPLTRRQVRRQNARVETCPPELRRKADLS